VDPIKGSRGLDINQDHVKIIYPKKLNNNSNKVLFFAVTYMGRKKAVFYYVDLLSNEHRRFSLHGMNGIGLNNIHYELQNN